MHVKPLGSVVRTAKVVNEVGPQTFHLLQGAALEEHRVGSGVRLGGGKAAIILANEREGTDVGIREDSLLILKWGIG